MVHTNFAPTAPTPAAYIAVNKNRLKSYDGKFYLKDRQTFQIEVFNPTQKVLLAEFHINGTRMQGGGLILNPGQRVFLERYLTENRKFMFSTYMASGTSEEIANAIINNGKIEVKFYEEIEQNYAQVLNAIYTQQTLPWYPTEYWYNTIGTSSKDLMNYTSNFDTNSPNYSHAYFSANVSTNLDRAKKITAKNVEKETGRIEKGDSSSQSFIYSDKHFSAYSYYSIQMQLLPVSQQVTTTDMIKHRVYCSNCGTKSSKANANFCAMCGERL